MSDYEWDDFRSKVSRFAAASGGLVNIRLLSPVNISEVCERAEAGDDLAVRDAQAAELVLKAHKSSKGRRRWCGICSYKFEDGELPMCIVIASHGNIRAAIAMSICKSCVGSNTDKDFAQKVKAAFSEIFGPLEMIETAQLSAPGHA